MGKETAPAVAYPSMPLIRKGPRLAVLLVTLLAYWLACFAPFEWVAPISHRLNDARLVADPQGPENPLGSGGAGSRQESAVVFGGSGWAELPTVEAGAWQISPNSFELRMTVACGAPKQFGPARLITASADARNRNFMLGQEGGALVIRLLRPGSDNNGTPEFSVEDFFASCHSQTVSLSIRDGALELTADGVSRLKVTNPSITLERWQTSYPVVLGDEASGNRGWLGEIRGLELRADGVLLNDGFRDLVLPAAGWVLSERAQRTDRFVLVPFSSENAYARQDIILNVLGFLPFGALLALGWPRRLNWFLAGVFAALLSCSIELGQIGFAGRITSTTDVVTNTTGGILGFLIAYYFLRRYRRDRPID